MSAARSIALRDVYWFLKPTLAVLLCYGVGLVGYDAFTSQRSAATAAEDRVASSFASLVVPDPSLSPAEVINIQLRGLADPNRADGAMQCFCFASPENRVVTGPMERFGRMVRLAPYDALSAPDAVIVGRATLVDGAARVLVSVLYAGQLQTFVWVLNKQTAPPMQDCWMTDAVFPLRNPQPPDERAEPVQPVAADAV
jgi:hypothetical protein